VKRTVALVQQAWWDIDASGTETMPLACGYLKAVLDSDERISAEVSTRIYNFGGGATPMTMLHRLLGDGRMPDVMAMSVFGWNFHAFGALATTYKQFRPDGFVIMGGTHVTNQADRVFRIYDAVDVVVNGEGEWIFRDLVNHWLASGHTADLHGITGVSFRDGAGTVVTTASRDRIDDLDQLPSPFLTGAIELTDGAGNFRYDVALLETNRGCPYKCAFCFWGGAVGQRVRAFSAERLAAEVELFAKLGVSSVVLCDANFGMLASDEEFVEMVIRLRERYGYPRNLVTSWAKNKGNRFYNIVRNMKRAGLHSSFTLALQSLDDPTLLSMGRRNMKLNEWRSLARFLQDEGFDIHGELIWGCPGETYESFLAGYDELCEVARVATYPLLILPNTTYAEHPERYGLRTLRSPTHDFEQVLAHATMSVSDNLRMHRFLFWARTIGENAFLRHIWTPLRRLVGMTNSAVLLSLDTWLDGCTDAAAQRLLAARATVCESLDATRIEGVLKQLYGDPEVPPLLTRWWRERIVPVARAEHRDFLTCLLAYDLLTRPVYEKTDDGAAGGTPAGCEVADIDGVTYYVRRDVPLRYDFRAIAEQLAGDGAADLSPRPRTENLFYRSGFGNYLMNHEFYFEFVARTEDELRPG
jgi:radical SAM superfamily enzyme YgiQ (UPF0313 family)